MAISTLCVSITGKVVLDITAEADASRKSPLAERNARNTVRTVLETRPPAPPPFV